VPQETGADRTLFVTESAADISRARFLGLLTSSGLSCTLLASWEHAEGTLNLVEVDGFAPLADPRIVDFRARLGAALHRLLSFGAYAVPLPAAVAVPDRAKG
jgi:hypothetical protein